MIEDLLDYLGVEDIRPLGVEVQARCPMHEKRTGERERRPDHWSINRMSGAHHCFSCEYSGSLTRLIIDVARISLWDAHALIRRFDVDLAEDETPWEPPIGMVVESRLSDFGPPPPRALERRRLTSTSADRFQVRWDYEEAAWVLPIKAPSGELWGWQTKGSDAIRNHPPGIKKGKTLFGLDCLRSNAMVMLVESPLDAVYLDTLSLPAVAAFGCQISEMQMRLLLERADEILLALDNDTAGQKETRRLLAEKWHLRIPISIFNYEGLKGKDPGELRPQDVHKAVETAPLAVFW